MSATLLNGDLHLPDLSIAGFRGIGDLCIPRLGRVTLFVGENGVGKTTLLDAVRVFAGRGRHSILVGILRDREELIETVDTDGDNMLAPNWSALFHGWLSSSDDRITIGPKEESQQLRIKVGTLSKRGMARWRRILRHDFLEDDVEALEINYQGAKQELPMLNRLSSFPYSRRDFWDEETEFPTEIRCRSLGPSLINNTVMSQFWDRAALTEDEDRAVEALNLIFNDSVERVAVIGDDRGSRSPHGRRAVVKVKGRERPVSLKSLGDGATRLFGVALALANSRNGFLLIDEAENGIHYSVQRDFWNMVLRTAQQNNVQVFATTHGWDCVVGFAQAAVALEEVEGVLHRVEGLGTQIRAVQYSEENLKAAAEHGIEVR